jgi:molybdopterin molybdotransferase
MMVPFEKALEIVLDSARMLGTERIDVADAAGQVLAEDVKSDIDMPPFNKSAMDGYACRREDLANELSIIETIAAGVPPERTIRPNECAKIMTGSMVPDGADCVIMVEFTENIGENRIRFTGEETADNICPKAEYIKSGEAVLSKGTLIKPQHVATLAAIGCAEPCVAIRPKVGVIATGSELVEPSQRPSLSQIRDSNSFLVAAQVEAVGAVTRNYGIARDAREAIDAVIKTAIAENDVVLISGGVSVGDFDFVPDVLKGNGIELLFEKIAIKPGKPTVFGISEHVFCFGLPGNPVLMGHDFTVVDVRVPLGESISRKKTARACWIPVVITDEGRAKPVEYHGSGHFSALCGADGLVCIPKGTSELKEGTMVSVRRI